MIQPPRGTLDILPGESEKWQELESKLRSVLTRANYREIRVPLFEHTELFKRGVGETTDIVNKEMYTFEDKSERSLTLRPEGTAGVARAYISHGLSRQTPPVKLWYCGPMFRYERPQTGRQRQFHQTGVEAFGSAGPAIDAEVIILAVECMLALNITQFEVHLNSIGCVNCRPAFKEKLKEALRPHLPELCTDCQDRFERNPLRMLDCKNENCKQFFKDAPSSLGSLCIDCREHWDGLLSFLEAMQLPDIKIRQNERLVRGLDYYGRTVFELISDHEKLGAQSTICAGGRYDYLLESLGGPPTAGVGWALGMERILLLMDTELVSVPEIFVVSVDAAKTLWWLTELRRQGFRCDADFAPERNTVRAFKRQFQQANKSGAKWVIVIGEQEIADQVVRLKDMATGEEVICPSIEDLIALINKGLVEKSV